jgi:hypothetical protein
MPVMSSLRHAAALCALAVAGACGDATAPLPSEGAPSALAFSFGGFGAPSRTVRLRGDTLVYTRRPWDWLPGVKIDSVRTVPSADAWRTFWASASRSGVGRWRGRYVAEGIVDGNGWGLDLTTADGVRIESEGSNAYPDRSGREHEGDMTAEFRDFLSALGALIGQPF